jgi:hypothetical protein
MGSSFAKKGLCCKQLFHLPTLGMNAARSNNYPTLWIVS